MHSGFATRHLCVLTLICAGVMAAAPQFQQTGSLEGEVRPSEQALGLTVEIFDTSRRMVVDRTATSLSGQFLFRNLQLGDYQVRVTDAQGNVVSQEFVRVSGSMDHVSLQLPERRTDRPPQGTVSVQQLGRIKIPKAARKEFDKGVAAAGKSDSEGAIKHYRKALEIAPDYMEAHTNIAVRLLESQQTQEAVQHLERAVELDPGSSLAFTNLAAAYMLLQRLPEAERAARQAERLDPASARARYMLGLALANLRQTAEALRYLNTVVDEIPRARLALAQLMVDADKREEAVDQLRKYIASRDVRDRDKATSWLATLEAPQGESAGAPGNIRASNGGH